MNKNLNGSLQRIFMKTKTKSNILKSVLFRTKMMNIDNNMESGKLQHMKQFVSQAREYIAFHSDKTLSAMSKTLGSIASSDTYFCPSRLEVSAFLASLWEVMSQAVAPHWQGIAVLAKAVHDPSCRLALVHKYRFLPVLANLLSDGLSFDKKMILLNLMEVLSYGVKINWEESYLEKLLKLLCEWVMNQTPLEPQGKAVGAVALTVLVNLCYSNPRAVHVLMRKVDTRELIKKLVSMKDGDSAGIQVGRLLMSLQGTRGAPTAHDVRNFLAIALQAFAQGIKDCNATQLKHSCSFFNDLASDTQTKTHVLNYDRYDAPLQEAIKLFPILLSKTSSQQTESEGNKCLESTLKFLLALVKTELYSLRPFYCIMAELCIKSSHVSSCTPSVYALLAAIITQYHEDGMMPDDLMAVLSTRMNQFLAPNSLDAKTAGLEWLQLVSALCECNATQDAVVHNVKTEQFERVIFEIVQTALQKGSLDSGPTYDSVVIACNLCLDLAQICTPWDSVLHIMLSNSSIQKILSSCLSTVEGERRKQALSIIKHPRFPTDRINQVFCAHESSDLTSSTENCFPPVTGTSLVPPEIALGAQGGTTAPLAAFSQAQEQSLDAVIKRLNETLENNQVVDFATSSIMELNNCKVSCLEQRLQASTIALQGATHNVASLNHSMALLQCINRKQQDVLYTTQLHNEKLKENVTKLSDHLSDAEQSVKRFQGKLSAERLDREQQLANSNHKHAQKIKELESEIESRSAQLSALNTQLTEMDNSLKNCKNKLSEQTTKNNELAGVLVKFEERVKQRDKKLEETNTHSASLQGDLSQAQQTIKTLEKTLLEREKRLTQLTSQLEEMHRIQEIIANLMGNKPASTNSSDNSMH